MRKRLRRLIVYPNDVQRITGKTERNSRLYLQKIKIHFNKLKHQFITIEELAQYMGISEEKILIYFDD